MHAVSAAACLVAGLVPSSDHTLQNWFAKLIWKGVIAAMGPLGGLPWTSAIFKLFIGEYWINNSPINIHQYWRYLYHFVSIGLCSLRCTILTLIIWKCLHTGFHGHGPRWCPSVDAWCAGVPWPKWYGLAIPSRWGTFGDLNCRDLPGFLPAVYGWWIADIWKPIPLTGGSMGWRWDSGFWICTPVDKSKNPYIPAQTHHIDGQTDRSINR